MFDRVVPTGRTPVPTTGAQMIRLAVQTTTDHCTMVVTVTTGELRTAVDACIWLIVRGLCDAQIIAVFKRCGLGPRPRLSREISSAWASERPRSTSPCQHQHAQHAQASQARPLAAAGSSRQTRQAQQHLQQKQQQKQQEATAEDEAALAAEAAAMPDSQWDSMMQDVGRLHDVGRRPTDSSSRALSRSRPSACLQTSSMQQATRSRPNPARSGSRQSRSQT